ncbi:hypothetical protein O5D80_008647 [Batrachochytrium dendrobatidis]|nr:hypothetical protein O5D80_008647 [Batrachochytrium dendrobatidis]
MIYEMDWETYDHPTSSGVSPNPIVNPTHRSINQSINQPILLPGLGIPLLLLRGDARVLRTDAEGGVPKEGGDMGPKVATRVFSGRGLHFTHQVGILGSPTIILRDTSTWITVYLLSPSPP